GRQGSAHGGGAAIGRRRAVLDLAAGRLVAGPRYARACASDQERPNRADGGRGHVRRGRRREGEVRRRDDGAGGGLALDAVVVERAGAQAAQRGAVGGDAGDVEGGLAAVGGRGAVLDLRVGRHVGRPLDRTAGARDGGRPDSADDRRGQRGE